MNSERIPLATAGLFVAWLIHDLEELVTMGDTSRILLQKLPDWMPVPDSTRQQGFTTRYLATGIATIGLIVAAAAVRGHRTQGRSAFYQNTLLAFGLHGLGHLALSVLTRGYSSGVATVPVVVLFFLVVGNPGARASGCSQQTQLSRRNRTARRVSRRRPHHRLCPHRKPALKDGDEHYLPIITLHESPVNP
jgi:hypothetical protein